MVSCSDGSFCNDGFTPLESLLSCFCRHMVEWKKREEDLCSAYDAWDGPVAYPG